MTLQQGWAALVARNLDAAQQAFTQAGQHADARAEALRGLARVARLQGNLDQAEHFAHQSMNLDPSPETILVKAIIMGERGQRANAYKQMLALKLVLPDDPFLLAAMGEQRIRQGYWDEGSALFIQAMQRDEHGFAFAHIREVVWDMSEAIAAGKLPADDPLKMINRVDHNTGQVTSKFFADARQAIAQGRAVSRQQSAPPQPAAVSHAPVMSSHAPTTSPQAPMMESRPSSPLPAMVSRAPMAARPVTTAAQPRAILTPTYEPLYITPPTTRSAFIDSMSEERALNAKLQDSIAKLDIPGWPSQNTTPIDAIMTIGSSMQSITERLEEARRSTFRVSQGNIFVQLYMERCFESFTQTIPTELTGGIVFDPALFTFLDINLLDGTLSKDFEVTTSDLTEITLADHAISAFAYFLGESLVRTYEGTWSYNERPDHAEIHIHDQTIKPYQLAKKWLSDPRRSPSPIYELIEQLNEELRHRHSTGMARYQHIDFTTDVGAQELAIKLAELWSFYCIRHARTPTPEIARQLKVVKDLDAVVVFEIDQAISPAPPAPHAAFHPKTRRLFYAYRRRTGEFLMLGRPACLAHVLGETHGELTADNAGDIVRFIATYHVPGAMLVESDEVAEARFAHLGVSGPKLQRRGGGNLALSLWLVEGKQARELTFMCVNQEQGVFWRYEH